MSPVDPWWRAPRAIGFPNTRRALSASSKSIIRWPQATPAVFCFQPSGECCMRSATPSIRLSDSNTLMLACHRFSTQAMAVQVFEGPESYRVTVRTGGGLEREPLGIPAEAGRTGRPERRHYGRATRHARRTARARSEALREAAPRRSHAPARACSGTRNGGCHCLG